MDARWFRGELLFHDFLLEPVKRPLGSRKDRPVQRSNFGLSLTFFAFVNPQARFRVLWLVTRTRCWRRKAGGQERCSAQARAEREEQGVTAVVGLEVGEWILVF
jgi:hypothetical protein